MKKKLLALFIMVVMVLAAVVGLVACDPTDEPNPGPGGKTAITVWVSETNGVKSNTEELITAFMDAHPDYKDKYNVTVEGISESEAATKMVTDVASGADIYCFAQDQLGRLIEANALAQLGVQATQFVTDNNDAGSVRAAQVSGKTYAYPITSDNGYFMYYDKSIIEAEHIDDLAAIVKDCEDNGKKFAFELEGSAWYTASFFFGAGCTSSWTMDSTTKKWTVADDFNSANGITALKAMQVLTKSPAYVNSSKAVEFGGSWTDDDGASHEGGAAVVVTGTWDSAKAKELLGDNYAVAKLPKVTVGEKTFQLGSYSGYKLMGVKPHTETAVQTFCNALAQELSGKAAQEGRFDLVGWGPSNKEVQAMDKVKQDVALAALAAQNAYAVPQGTIHGGWWDFAKLLGKVSKDAADDKALQDGLDEYTKSLNKYEQMTEEDMSAFGVVGAIASLAGVTENLAAGQTKWGDWNTDVAMIESPDGTWTSKVAIVLAAGDQFQVRQGQAWTVEFGAVGEDGKSTKDNYKITAENEGTYKIKLVLEKDKDGNILSGVVSLVPAE